MALNVPGGGLEPPHLAAYAPQTYLSTNSNIRAKELYITKREAKIRISHYGRIKI